MEWLQDKHANQMLYLLHMDLEDEQWEKLIVIKTHGSMTNYVRLIGMVMTVTHLTRLTDSTNTKVTA